MMRFVFFHISLSRNTDLFTAVEKKKLAKIPSTFRKLQASAFGFEANSISINKSNIKLTITVKLGLLLKSSRNPKIPKCSLKREFLPSRYTTLFQSLQDVYTTSPTLKRRHVSTGIPSSLSLSS